MSRGINGIFFFNFSFASDYEFIIILVWRKTRRAIKKKIKNRLEQKQTKPSPEFKKQVCNLENKECIEENLAKEDINKKEVTDKNTKMFDNHTDAEINSQTTSVILIENLSSRLSVREVTERLRKIGTLLEYWFER